MIKSDVSDIPIQKFSQHIYDIDARVSRFLNPSVKVPSFYSRTRNLPKNSTFFISLITKKMIPVKTYSNWMAIPTWFCISKSKCQSFLTETSCFSTDSENRKVKMKYSISWEDLISKNHKRIETFFKKLEEILMSNNLLKY